MVPVRSRASRSLVAAAAVVAALLEAGAAAARTSCEQLASLALADTTIVAAHSVPAGSFAPPRSPSIADLPAFCRVVGVIAPTADSTIGFETWLPVEGWNGKFQGIGNGGFAGEFTYTELAKALRLGWATAGTDGGHVGAGPIPFSQLDGTWALGHPEKVVDFGPRAMHLTTVNAKAIVRAFYGRRPRRSYYTGCSTGGRQGLMEAQQYPGDYDGLVVGAPANYWTRLMVMMAALYQVRYGEPDGHIPPERLSILADAVNARCDGLDGIVDGVLDDPRTCPFDPAPLECQAGQDPSTCFTAKEVALVKAAYAGPRHARTGERLFPGFLPGAEVGENAWAAWITNGAPGSVVADHLVTGYFKFFVFQDPAYDVLGFDFDADVAFNDASIGRVVNAIDPDLRPFKRRGAKMILWHGWNDASIPALNTLDYHESVLASFAGRHGTRARAERRVGRFLRLFMAPGVRHCLYGPGPSMTDMLTPLERWVERGRPPREIIASRVTDGVVDRTRPLCPYPQVAVYQGTGSTDDAANFRCELRSRSAGG